MKYKLINSKTNEEHLCDKISIDGFDYYVSDDESQIGENVLWVKQTYHGAEEYANYIGKVYILKKCFPKGKEIILKDFYPKKSLDEIRQSIKVFLEKTGKQRTTEQIEENAIKNQATSGNLYLKIGYNISENDIKKVIATNNPNIDISQIIEEPNETLIHQIAADLGYRMLPDDLEEGIKAGYKESQKTHPFSKKDLISFAHFYFREEFNSTLQTSKSTEETFQLWKEQQPKTIWYG